MTTTGLVQGLFIALSLVMTGLGLSLRWSDFKSLRPRGGQILVALGAQMIVLPIVAYGVVSAFGLTGFVAAGMLLLAATPSSITANLYSHLFGGNVALTVVLTGLNTLLCAMTLPVLAGWALAHFTGDSRFLPVLIDRALSTTATVIVPVVVGMSIANVAPGLAERLAQPVKVLSGVIVLVFSLAAIFIEWEVVSSAFLQLGASVLALNLMSALAGYLIGHVTAFDDADPLTLGFQVSIHNAIQAIYIAIAVVEVQALALPAAIYSISMNVVAVCLGLLVGLLRRRLARQADRRSAGARRRKGAAIRWPSR